MHPIFSHSTLRGTTSSLDSLMSHQTLAVGTGTTNFFFKLDKPSEFFSPGRRVQAIFHFVLAWREGFPVIPRESRGVKSLGRVIGVFYHLLWTHKRACIRSTTLLSWPSTPLHGVHFRPRHFEVSSGVSSTQRSCLATNLYYPASFSRLKEEPAIFHSFWLGGRACPRPLVSHVVLKVSAE